MDDFGITLRSRSHYGNVSHPSLPFSWAAVLVIAAAAFARLPWLTWHSVDVDEAFSLFWARVPLATLIPNLLALRGDPHPPGYYSLLKPWVSLIGDNEVGLRLFSVFAGIIFAALVYRLGREVFSDRVGLAAALLAALNPALVYESLDARMYMPAAAFMVAGSLSLWRFARQGGRVHALTAFSLLALACYSHLAGALATIGLGVGLVLARFSGRRLARAMIILAAVGIVYLPYALNAWRISSASGAIPIRGAPGPGEILTITASWSLFHNAPLADWLGIGSSVVLWGAAIWGLASKSERLESRGYLIGGLVVPLALLVILSTREPILQPKMLVVTTLAPLLLTASLPRRIWLVSLVLTAQLWGFVSLWQPAAQRENWRAAGAYLKEHVGPHDVVLTHLHFYEEPLRFYYSGPIVTPFGSRLTTYEEVRSGLEPFLGAEVLWLVQSGIDYTDPDRILESWLSERYPLVTEQYPNHIAVKGFLLHATGFPRLGNTATMNYRFANDARVTGVWLDSKSLPAQDTWLHPPSNWLHLTLYATPDDYTFTLEDGPGNVWGASLAHNGQAVQAEPGEFARLDYDINLNPDAPPGVYKIVLRVVGPQGYVPRADNGEAFLILDTVDIIP